MNKPIPAARRKARLALKSGRVEMSHGAGGRAMAALIDGLFMEAFDNDMLRKGDDQAAFEVEAGRMVMSTDSFVIQPLFFPGGDIGAMAVHGTVNDLAMSGARPLYLSAGFILEEGLPLAQLADIVRSMAEAAKEANVAIITGDTKVVERGSGDGVFINTAGIGVVPPGLVLSGDQAQVGDAVLVSGSLGDHGVAVMSKRENLTFETSIQSDSQSLNDLVEQMVAAVGGALHCLRDPTRGGLAACLNEIANQSSVGIRLEESAIPIRPEVKGACELLGLDPLNVANEGKLVAFCALEAAQSLVAAMRAHKKGAEAAIIGQVVADPQCFVQMQTSFGGHRMIDWLHGDPLPRIC